MTAVRMGLGLVLIGLGVVVILICVALAVYGFLFVPDMDTEKKVSESLVTLAIAAWCVGSVVAGKLLRRH